MKVSKENIVMHLIEYQLSMSGTTWSDVKDDEKWYFNNTLTSEQAEEFKKYATPLIKKTFKCSLEKAKKEFMWFDLSWGLKIKENEYL